MMPEPDSAAPIDAAVHTASGHRHVFVYGTLRAGGSNDIRRYSPTPCWVGFATVTGTLYDFGGWPGLRLQGSSVVVGEVWRIDASVEPLLDRLEGVQADGAGEYARRSVTVQVGGAAIACLVYEIHADRLPGRPLIPHGDWMAHTRKR